MISTALMSAHVDLVVLVAILLGFPFAYFILSYFYLISWHRKASLWDVIIHENGRLTLRGSLFYFDHFVACVPMVGLFALCTAGGFALGSDVPVSVNASRVSMAASILLVGSGLFCLLALGVSVFTVGWRQTRDYTLQRIERDGIMSRGGNWNQLQVSNIPIALGTMGLSSALASVSTRGDAEAHVSLAHGGIACIGIAATLSMTLSASSWCGWRAFLNPRWIAHSIREIATYPLTGIPIALAGVLITEAYLTGRDVFAVEPRVMSLILISLGVGIMTWQLLALRNTDISIMAQRPSFAPTGLSTPYLLCSHVFEHFLDFVLIAPLAGGIYALLRFLAL